jgi:hypothetical protein
MTRAGSRRFRRHRTAGGRRRGRANDSEGGQSAGKLDAPDQAPTSRAEGLVRGCGSRGARAWCRVGVADAR